MKRKSVIAIAVAFFLSFCVGTGKSAWLIAASSKEYTNAQLTQGIVEGDKVVCYIDKDTTENQYTSIEVALAKAKSTSGSQTVYVPSVSRFKSSYINPPLHWFVLLIPTDRKENGKLSFRAENPCLQALGVSTKDKKKTKPSMTSPVF